jgi:hypothetical protein
MRPTFRALILTTAALCASAAFAADQAKVNIPFNFETHGVAFPAGSYVATLDLNKNVLRLQNVQEPQDSLMWVVSPADAMAISSPMVLNFDGLGNTYKLRTVQLGSRITPRLDAPAKHHDAGSFVAAVSGQ